MNKTILRNQLLLLLVLSFSYTITSAQTLHPKPTICIDKVSSITEGNSGQTQLKFTVSLSDTTCQVVKVCYGTRNGSATAPEDYVATSGTLTFAPGTKYQKVTVLVNGDTQL